MLHVFKRWFQRYLSDEEAVIVLLLLAAALATILLLGDILAPFIAALVFAFVLQGLVAKLKQKGVGHLLAVNLVFVLFVGLTFAAFFVLFPIVWRQLSSLSNELPGMVNEVERYILLLSAKYPNLISEKQVNVLWDQVGAEAARMGQWLVSFSLSGLVNIIQLLIYLVLVPILVFFLLKDKDTLLSSMGEWLPNNRSLMTRIWTESNNQFANYIRGKFMEIMIVGIVTYVSFRILGLNYPTLLAILVGLSVLIPYIGAAVVTIPVALIGFLQWGFGSEFATLMIVYGVIQALDGNVLVPLLFSEVVNLHPVSIILSVLVFGGIWGLWGVFFAIPLATLIKAVLTAWPRQVEAA